MSGSVKGEMSFELLPRANLTSKSQSHGWNLAAPTAEESTKKCRSQLVWLAAPPGMIFAIQTVVAATNIPRWSCGCKVIKQDLYTRRKTL